MHPGQGESVSNPAGQTSKPHLLFAYGKWKDQLQKYQGDKEIAECKFKSRFSPGFIIADLRPRLAGDLSSSEATSFLFPENVPGGMRGLSCPLRVGVVLLLEVLGEPRLLRRFRFPSTRLSVI